MIEAHMKAATAYAAQIDRVVKLGEGRREEAYCILSPEWGAHFKAKAAQDAARFAELERELATLMARVKEIKRDLAEGPRQLNTRFQALMSDPPQGVFDFRGDLVFLPDTGHTILVAADGSPIYETFRKATGEEHAEASRLADHERQLQMFPESEPTQAGTESSDMPF
jgi:hypothetical protein